MSVDVGTGAPGKSQRGTESGSLHGEAELLLPWYVNGSLQHRERSVVERWLRVSVKGRGQLQVWQCVAQNIAAIVVDRASQSANESNVLAALEQSVGHLHSKDANRSNKEQSRTAAATAHRLRIVLFLGFCTVVSLAVLWVLYA